MEDGNQTLFGVPTQSFRTTTTELEPPDGNTMSRLSEETETTTLNVVSQERGEPPQTTTTRRLVSHDLMRAIELNCEGVSLLQSGGQDEEQAIAVFKRSLACVKSDLAQETPSSPSTTLSHRTGSNALSMSHDLDDEQDGTTRRKPGTVQALLVSPPLETICCIDHHHHIIVPVQVLEPNCLDDNLFVYTKAFVFQPCGGCYGAPGKQSPHRLGPSCSTVDTELLSATIIYNIGLALHIKAIRTDCVFHQRRSLSLYEMSMALLRRILSGKDTDIPDDNGNHFLNLRMNVAHNESMGDITSLLIACSNNVGHLSYYLQDNYEQSWRAMSNLQFLLNLVCMRMHHEDQERRQESSSSSLDPSSRRPSTSFFTLLEQSDLQGFRWNVMFMFPPTSAPAA